VSILSERTNTVGINFTSIRAQQGQTLLRTSCPCAFLIKHYVMKAYGRVDVYIHIFLISALARDEWSV
jgi:hypothetical protein